MCARSENVCLRPAPDTVVGSNHVIIVTNADEITFLIKYFLIIYSADENVVAHAFRKMLQVAERSLACCLIHGTARKLAMPAYYSKFDFAAMESEVARVNQSCFSQSRT